MDFAGLRWEAREDPMAASGYRVPRACTGATVPLRVPGLSGSAVHPRPARRAGPQVREVAASGNRVRGVGGGAGPPPR